MCRFPTRRPESFGTGTSGRTENRRGARAARAALAATGLAAAAEFTELVRAEAPEGVTPAQAAIAWLWQHPAVSSVIPGARNVDQAAGNAAAGSLAPLGDAFDAGIRRIYDATLRDQIHPRW